VPGAGVRGAAGPVGIRPGAGSGRAGRGDRAGPAAATLWAGLHGVVTLRADRPAFPWPSLDDMIAVLLTSFA
jgi:hypothetical protein